MFGDKFFVIKKLCIFLIVLWQACKAASGVVFLQSGLSSKTESVD